MAIIHCPDCGSQVSEHADICNKCSYSIRKLKASQSIGNTQSDMQNVSVPSPASNSGLIVTGYILALLSLLFFPILFAIGGVVVGVVTIGKGATGHGIAHIILSIVLGTIGAIIGAVVWTLFG